MHYLIKLIAIFVLVVISNNGIAASFDCKLPNLNSIESLICETEALSKWDDDISAIYKEALAIDENEAAEIRHNQRLWIKWRNKICSNDDDVARCLDDFYRFAYYRLKNQRDFIVHSSNYKRDCIEQSQMSPHEAANCNLSDSIKNHHKNEVGLTGILDHYYYYLVDDFEMKHPLLDIKVKVLFRNIVRDYGQLWDVQERICDQSGGASSHHLSGSSTSRWAYIGCLGNFRAIFEDYATGLLTMKGPG
ncbi:lysozyme inhibitor LprI family protein [Bermanella sp. R86510]|uniref:lysozyme inhibitor LprI family protein n=1 Tax=unclassified Bermanella TaxID=2627862 RepID=UPI0037C88E13